VRRSHLIQQSALKSSPSFFFHTRRAQKLRYWTRLEDELHVLALERCWPRCRCDAESAALLNSRSRCRLGDEDGPATTARRSWSWLLAPLLRAAPAVPVPLASLLHLHTARPTRSSTAAEQADHTSSRQCQGSWGPAGGRRGKAYLFELGPLLDVPEGLGKARHFLLQHLHARTHAYMPQLRWGRTWRSTG
jgi:hypothetical protein